MLLLQWVVKPSFWSFCLNVHYANIRWIIEKAREFQKNIYFCFIDYAKAFDCVDHNKLWKILKEMGIPDHLTCLLRNLHAGQEATVSSQTRDQTQVPCIGRWILNHWTTRELPSTYWKWKSLSRVWLFATPWTIHSPWNSPGQNTGGGSFSLLQGIIPSQGPNPGFPYCRWILYQLSHQWNPRILEWVVYPFSSGSSWPKNQIGVSCITSGFFTNWATREAPLIKGTYFLSKNLKEALWGWEPCWNFEYL